MVNNEHCMVLVATVKPTVLWSWTILHNDQDVFPKFFNPTPATLHNAWSAMHMKQGVRSSIEQAMHEASPNAGSQQFCCQQFPLQDPYSGRLRLPQKWNTGHPEQYIFHNTVAAVTDTFD